MNTLLYPFVALILIGLLELYVMIGVGGLIGPFTTVFLVIFTAALGLLLMRYQGFKTLQRAQEAMARGDTPELEMLEGVALLLGGALLLIPGFLSDGLGFLMLVPPLRKVVIRWMLRQRGGPRPPSGGSGDGPRTLEGEFWRD
ncbi:hypothetical protein BOW53_03405 [Solemya pervernicosa gill symbiont]|uniref:Exlusion protein FxsA n=2 Tax=Gammaproteobacteria incertae sedis TaxID=118884 RepID=A0A1T2L8X8_9GAMM|nr:FxsA family protein [Candidatus Reidiella endopervernicosa]OOZ41568.1 hypothetical protein BOW53_03405 [Solemya pervernicosa gill symbiont]QKQ27974.1 FxsA family protein [Candidatus Reidiella endopervernicosa]